jgi:hypothetical protein
MRRRRQIAVPDTQWHDREADALGQLSGLVDE